MRRTPLFLLLTLALGPIVLQAQSPNCSAAVSPREHAICSNPQLAALDTEVTAAYKSAAVQLSPTSFALVQADQSEWLNWLSRACPADGIGIRADLTSCLQVQYRIRKSQLLIQRIGTALVYDRARFTWVRESIDSDNPADPGFFEGIFTWPQIDEPTGPQSAWNAIVESQLIHSIAILSGNDGNKTPDAITTSAAGDITATAWLIGLSGRLITTNVEITSATWSDRNSRMADTAYNYWLDRGRELQPEDVFRPNSDWQQKLSALAADRLKSDAASSPNRIAPAPANDPQLDRDIQSTVSNPAHWALTRSGLAITLPQFHGNFLPVVTTTIHLTWTELKPILEPSLEPSTLPAATIRDPRYVKI